MIFYFAPKTVSLASHIALEQAGAEYESRQLDFSITEQQSGDYLKINPKGRVPALVTDQGSITETPAILAFIAQSYPAAKLAPLDDPFKFAKMQEFNNYLCATVHVAHAQRAKVFVHALELRKVGNFRRPPNIREHGQYQILRHRA